MIHGTSLVHRMHRAITAEDDSTWTSFKFAIDQSHHFQVTFTILLKI